MRSRLVLGLLACALPRTAFALVGIDTDIFKPPCAYSCARALGRFMLSCSSHDSAGGGHDHGGSPMTSPACRAGDTAYLRTLAWCMHTKCAEDAVPAWQLEKFWAEQASGDPTMAPKWDYGATIANISEPPTTELATGDMLNSTALAPKAAWQAQYNTMVTFEGQETLHARYGVALLVTAFATPITLTLLRRLPYMTTLLDRLNPYLVYPSTLGTYQVRALPHHLGNAPTLGQALYVALILTLNIVLSAVSFRSHQPNAWYATQYQEVLAWVMYRTGILGFAMLPVVLLFAGRNNVLLWLSDWSHATYVLLHRWVGRIFGLQVLLHSILALVLYKDTGAYPAEEKVDYWIWGAVATVAVSVLLVGSGLYVRRWSYEVFLVSHILLAVFVIVGCWYHVELRFKRMYGYEMWIYAACAVWFSDRLIRLLRVLKAGVRRARVTEIGNDFVRVDIDGIRWGTTPGQHAYLYFPTLNPLRPWENHPFSLLPSSLLAPSPSPSPTRTKTTTARPPSEDTPSDPEKEADQPKTTTTTTTTNTLSKPTPAGITLFIRKSTGLTRALVANPSLLTLLDGPYPNNPTSGVLQCDRVLLIAGGIGVTGLLPWARSHANVRLCWSVKESGACLVDALGGALEEVVREKEVRVGRRFDVAALLQEEVLVGWARIGVVVCGPGGLCDEVRALVVEMGRREKGVVLELEVDAYSW
ncbi:ferric reductase like transmembrane component-domain-containing protein [Chaetomidium leptoderma]|uniref:Ferric reductase like transmembrane component-domain-containing protein n=1 Tax=Chaetomidium leptoderma TaxID=669021 RepID=A0AAN6VLP3_9PEZI|nr:ferric reductase like transmembrane component-domain-containing protein [Chaetomidium leptoderma]